MDLLSRAPDDVLPAQAPDFSAYRPKPAYLPGESRLSMPAQDLRSGRLSSDRPVTSPVDIDRRRAFLFGVTALIAAFGMAVIGDALSWQGWQPLEAAFFVLFSILFTWMAFGFVSYGIGLWVMHHQPDDLGLTPDAAVPILRQRTAVLMPVCNEDAHAVANRLNKIRQSLLATHQAQHFDIFILSDTRNAEDVEVERKAFMFLLQTQGQSRVYYRHRTINTDRKTGNIAEWCTRFGGAYAHMVVLDADSLMSGDTLVHLAGAMERHDGIGLIQTAPRLINQTSVFARCAQFAARLYGPAAACGAAWWSGAESSYWGHNAIIRVRAFTESAGLPHLPGSGPFGGHILSHDFVEAGLLRRAGWAVHLAPRLEGSYEESPPTLTDALQRDRRWCQGNIQHAAVVGTSGLHWINRLQLAAGIINYMTAPLWLALVGVGAGLSLSHASLDGTSHLTAMFVTTFALLLLPKVVAAFMVLVQEGEREKFGGRLAIGGSLIVEMVLSTLLTPIIMLSHSLMVVSVLTGQKSGWKSQRRAGYAVDPRELAMILLPHTITGLLLAAIVTALAPEAMPYLAGVIISLVFSAPLAAFTAQDTPEGMRDILRIPEEPRTVSHENSYGVMLERGKSLRAI